MKNVIIYSRVSTDEQSEGYSLDYQEESMIRYCQSKGYEIVRSYREDHSAKTFNRPKWKEMMEFLKEKKRDSVDAILFLRWDRFSRNLLNSLNEIAALKKMGIAIETMETQIDTSTPESLLLQAISLAIPQIENEKNSIRTQEGSHKARMMGCFTGIAPRGYRNLRLPDESSSLEFNSDSSLIQKAFEKMASGIYGADEIRRWLNMEGVKISKNQFLNLIRNVTYTGKIYVKPFKGDPAQIVQGLHPALVSDELFAAANDVLKGRRRKMKFKKDKSDLYPLKGFIICPEHGRSYTAYGAKGRNGIYHYYLCSWKGGNQCPRYPIDMAHTAVEDILSQIQFSAKTLLLYRSALEKVFERESIDKKKTIEQIQNKLEQLNKRKKKIQEDYMDGKLGSVDFQELKMGLDAQTYDLNQNLKDLQGTNSPLKDYLTRFVPMMEDLVGFYRRSNGEIKKKILGCIFSKKFHFEDGKVAAVEFTNPIQILLNTSKGLGGRKKEKEVISDLLSYVAPPVGLEPTTL